MPSENQFLQPFLHELLPAVAAPYQAWIGRDGQLRRVGIQGIYLGDTRLACRAVVSINGQEPEPIGAGPRTEGTVAELPGRASVPVPGGTPTQLPDAGQPTQVPDTWQPTQVPDAGQPTQVPDAAQQLGASFVFRGLRAPTHDPAVLLERRVVVTSTGVEESLTLRSALTHALDVELELELECDLAGIDHVRSGRPAAPLAPDASRSADPASASWRRPEGTASAFSAPGAELTAGASGVLARWPVQLEALGTHTVSWTLTGSDPSAVVSAGSFGEVTSTAAAPATAQAAQTAEPPSGAATDPRPGRLLRQARADIRGLTMSPVGSPRDSFLAAGAPWYFTLFGRDSLWSARLLLQGHPSSGHVELAAGTLRALADLQGKASNPVTAEEPGKILHELRRAGFTIASEESGGVLELPPLYYGTVDATPLWICLLHEAWRAGLPDGQVRALLDSCVSGLAWMRDFGDADGDGFLEYPADASGLVNQGWKDSSDALRRADGTLAEGPIALCEVQGYAYQAAVAGAELLNAFGRDGGPWLEWAGRLRGRFREAFWVEDPAGRYPAMALDGGKSPVASPSSNMGHLLATGILDAEESRVVAERLMRPDLFSGFGIRTLSADHPGYWPLSYHCGSVWTHDTAIVLSGLHSAGHQAEARMLAEGLLDAAEHFGYRLPELFGGFSVAEQPRPVPYPASCFPQAWAAASAEIISRVKLAQG